MSHIRFIAWLLVVVVAPVTVWAQPLAKHLPGDAIVYVGWSGSEELGPGFDASHLKAIIEISQIDRMISEVLPQAVEKLADSVPDDDAKDFSDFMSNVGLAVWKHPTALYFGGVDFEGDEPMPQMAFVCQAGKDAKKVQKYLANLIEKGDPDVPLSVKTIGPRVILTVGSLSADQQGALGLAATSAPAPCLADNKAFQSAMQKTIPDPVAVAYLDAQRLIGLIDTGIRREVGPDEIEQWEMVRDALGLDGVQRVVVGTGFDGKKWGMRGFVEAPAPRRGVLALMDQTPLQDELLAAIPETASMANGFNFDLAGLVDLIKEVANEFDPNASRQIDDALGGVKEMLGFDLMKSLLKPLGAQWAFYVDDHVGGSGAFGSVVVNRLRDPDRFKRTLGRLELVANAMMAEKMKDEDFIVKFKFAEVDGTELHYLALPAISPTWAVRDGNLYLALQPQFVAGAAHHVASNGKSITDNPDFVQLRKQLGAEKFGGFSFVDLPKVAPDSYFLVTLLSRLFVGFADMVGVEDTPTMVMPPMYKLKPHLTASASFSWSDKDGYYVRSVEAFPSSSVLSVGTTGIVTWLMTSSLTTGIMSTAAMLDLD